MGTVQLRQQLHEYIDKADDRLLALVYGMFKADMEEKDWWDELSPSAQRSIERAQEQLGRGEGRSHEEVMREFKAKYKGRGL